MEKKIELLANSLPEVQNLKGETQNPEFHPEGDVFVHTMNALKHAPEDYILQMALLLHDIGKPDCRKVKNGRIMHPKHAERSYVLSGGVLDRLGVTSKDQEEILWLIRNHDFFMTRKTFDDYESKLIMVNPLCERLCQHYLADRDSSESVEISTKARETVEAFIAAKRRFTCNREKWLQMKEFTLLSANEIEALGLKDECEVILADVERKYQDGALGTTEEIRRYVKNTYQRRWYSKNLAVSKDDFGTANPAEVGKIYKELLDALVAEQVTNERNALLEIIKNR